jgi:adenylyltransferase/sulfurtransferase
MNQEQLTRYGRHIQLPEIGLEGQRRIAASRVLIIGLGGLGSPAAMYLGASGVGRLILADFDRVELSNLQRQIIHATPDIGRHKVDSARDRICALNPDVTVDALPWAPDGAELNELVAAADVVLDASDNFATRFEINAACVRTRTPLVWAAAVRLEAQLGVVEPSRATGPCYQCLYPDAPDDGEPCDQVGVLAPLLGIIGSLQAMEALKILVGMDSSLSGRVLLIDGRTLECRRVRLRKDPACPACGELSGEAAR